MTISPSFKHYVQVALGVLVAVLPTLASSFPAEASVFTVAAQVAGTLLAALGGNAVANALAKPAEAPKA